MTRLDAPQPGLDHSTLLELIHYDRDSGVFAWRQRDRCYFSSDRGCAVWNGRYAGKRAGGIQAAGRGDYQRRVISIFGTAYYAHHLAWFYVTGQWPRVRLDHRDGNALNNRWENLRYATQAQNMQNSRRRSDNQTGFKGVSFNRARGRFQAHISINRKSRYLGLFDTAEEAHAAYCAAAKEHFGEFARLS